MNGLSRLQHLTCRENPIAKKDGNEWNLVYLYYSFLFVNSLSNNIIYAPLAGCSDYPFRQMSALYKPGLMYCEMVKMEALPQGAALTGDIADALRTSGVATSLCGSVNGCPGRCFAKCSLTAIGPTPGPPPPCGMQKVL